MHPIDQRHDVRFEILCGEDLDAFFEIKNGEESQSVQGRLIDLSDRGAKLSIPANVQTDENTVLRIRCLVLDVDLTISVHILWTRPYKDGGSVLGCRFEQPVPDDVLSRLASAGRINCRKDTRQAIPVLGYLREVGEAAIGVRVDNFSAGGLRLYAPKAVEPGQRVLLKLRNEDGEVGEVIATSIWSLPTAAGYFVGCSFPNNLGFKTLAKLTQFQSMTSRCEHSQHSRRISRWVWIGLAATVTLCAVYVFGA